MKWGLCHIGTGRSVLGSPFLIVEMQSIVRFPPQLTFSWLRQRMPNFVRAFAETIPDHPGRTTVHPGHQPAEGSGQCVDSRVLSEERVDGRDVPEFSDVGMMKESPPPGVKIRAISAR